MPTLRPKYISVCLEKGRFVFRSLIILPVFFPRPSILHLSSSIIHSASSHIPSVQENFSIVTGDTGITADSTSFAYSRTPMNYISQIWKSF